MKQHIPHRRAIRIAVILTVCLAVFAVTGYAWMQTQLVSRGNTISPASVSLSVSDSQLQFKDRWEPGQKNETEPLSFTNSGSTPLLCRVQLSRPSGSAELLKQLSLTLVVTGPDGQEETYAIPTDSDFSVVLSEDNFQLAPGDALTVQLRGECVPASGSTISGGWLNGSLALDAMQLTIDAVQSDGAAYFDTQSPESGR